MWSLRKIVTLSLKNNLKTLRNSDLTYGTALFKFQFRPIKTLNSSKIRYPKATGGMLRTTMIDQPEFHALFTKELKDLIALFKKHDYELRIAGGAVRDLLMGKQSHDIDFATTATPDEMKEMFELEKIRMIHTKGESHGTITCRINDMENFEVTTLRIDVRTDGRHAEVAFTKDWQLDASRRDLTINSMFLGFDGTVYDYFNGIEDVKNRKVRFVGQAADRIQEDYLRILRYFRFYGRMARGPAEHEESTLSAIRDNAEGLAGISGERIWVELKKIVVGNYAGSIMKVMYDTGIAKYMGLPTDGNTEEFEAICENTEGHDPEPMTRIAALLANEEQVYELNTRLKMSTDELKTGLFIVNHRDKDPGSDKHKFYQHLLVGVSGKEPKTKNRICELLKYKGLHDDEEFIRNWKLPKLPINGQDVMDIVGKKGPITGKVLDELRRRWILSDFKLTKDELLSQIGEIVEAIPPKKKS